MANQEYLVYDPVFTFVIPDFGNDEVTHCPLTYTIDFDASLTFVAEVAELKLQW